MTIHRCAVRRKRPDGPAPYYGIYASGRWGSLVSMWDQIKTGVSEAIAAHGGTITHHHAVGRDHAPSYDRQRPDPFAAAPRAHCPVWGVLTTALHSHDELVIAFDPPTRRPAACVAAPDGTYSSGPVVASSVQRKRDNGPPAGEGGSGL